MKKQNEVVIFEKFRIKPSQKERFRMRQKQIILAKKLGKKHIFQKEF